MRVDEAIKELNNSKNRKFKQTYDLIVSLKNIDLKKPENRITKELVLPHGRGKDISVCVIGEKGDLAKADLERLGKDKKEARKIAKKYDFFLAEAPLMVVVGKTIGKYLGPKGKMPKPIPPSANKTVFVEQAKKSIRIKIRDTPVIHTVVGYENMDEKQIEENVKFVLDNLIKTLPKGRPQIRDIYLKLTMSKPVKMEY